MPEHDYDKNQRFNFITRLMHATRYRNLVKIAMDLTPRYGPKLRVLDIGCGPGTAFKILNDARPDIEYLGVELLEDFCTHAENSYGNYENFSIICSGIEDKLDVIDNFDLIIGLESFEHIPESIVVRVAEAIGASNFQKLYITVPNEIGPAIAIKNCGSFLMGYHRYKEYTWAETFYSTCYQLDKVGLHGTRHKGFDWRWLAQTLRQNTRILRMYTSPSQIVPRSFSASIGFLCEKRVTDNVVRD